jgi:hypothetical protein
LFGNALTERSTIWVWALAAPTEDTKVTPSASHIARIKSSIRRKQRTLPIRF